MSLKPCPFCGGAVKLEETVDRRKPWYGVVCRNTTNLGGTCAIETRPSATKEAAIARWNLRSAEPAQPVACVEPIGDGNTDAFLLTPQPAGTMLYTSPQPVGIVTKVTESDGVSVHWTRNVTTGTHLYTNTPINPETSWVELEKEAASIVRGKSLWKRFIDGTPLSNDISCWMADFALEHTSPQMPPMSDEEIIAKACRVRLPMLDYPRREDLIAFARTVRGER